jgi:Putative DNA-binding domain
VSNGHPRKTSPLGKRLTYGYVWNKCSQPGHVIVEPFARSCLFRYPGERQLLADIPFQEIAQEHLLGLIEDSTMENRRLDYKRDLSLETKEQRAELLRDITAMANSDGGIIVFGVAEGSGENAGVAVAVDGIAGSPDMFSTTIDSLLRDNVEERLSVQQRSVPLSNGRFAYLIRVPASPLAPHMLSSIRTSLPRFFSRQNTANQPMSAREIKEAVLKHGAAVERAAQRIEDRVSYLRGLAPIRDENNRHPTDPVASQAILHVVPLFPHQGGWNYANPEVAERLRRVQPFALVNPADSLSFTQHGAFQDLEYYGHTGFLRDGALEHHMWDIVETSDVGLTRKIIANELEDAVALAFDESASLTTESLLPTPVLIQMHLLGVGDTRFFRARRARFASPRILSETEVASDALVLTEWVEAPRVLRQLLDHVWQAWGYPRCQNYDEDGTRMRFNRDGNRIV